MAHVWLKRLVVAVAFLSGGAALAASGPQYRNLDSVGLRRLPNGDFEVTRTSRYNSFIKGLWEGKTGQGGSRELVREGSGKVRLGGGQASDVPFRMKMSGPKKGSAGAARTFGKFAFKNGGRALLGPAGALLTGAQLLGWVWNEGLKRWEKPDDGALVSDGYDYWYSGHPGELFDTGEAACEFAVSVVPRASYSVYNEGSRFCYSYKSDGTYLVGARVNRSESACPEGFFRTLLGCMEDAPIVPVTEPEFLQEVPDDDIDEDVANDLDEELNWPTVLPEIAPTWLPMSDPVPNPQYDPAYDPSQDPGNLERYKLPWLQPGTMLSPANTPYEPWRISIRPWDIYLEDPTGLRQPVPLPWPDGTPWTPPEWWKFPWPDPFGGEYGPPAEGSGGTDGPQLVLCDIYPEISACQVLGEPGPEEDLPDTPVQLQVDPDTGWGEGGGSCPDPIVISVFGTEYAISWDPVCSFAIGMRPLVIALAWFTVALAFFAFGRRDT